MELRLLFSALTPAQVRHFYGADNISFNGVAGDGSGQTIAIVDAYNQPNLLNSTDPNFATSDLHQFDVMFGLPDPPAFTKIDERGGTDIPTQQVTAWSEEESLDVEWAHVLAPMAKIVLVECDTNADGDLFDAGVTAAQSYPGVTVISMSFVKAPEPPDDPSRDSLFSPTTGITYLASAGDYGAQNTGYPAFSPYVIGIGGTTTTLGDSSGTYGSETTWNNTFNGTGTGGQPSKYEPKPAYQAAITLGGNKRTVPDVAFDGDPSTGVYIYDSSEGTTGHGFQIGGTSVGAPCWAGLVAVANQGRALEGLGPLDGFTQTLPRLYTLPSSDFHDITTGSNGQFGNGGFSAGPGYDLTTGLGTPVANQLIPDLAGGAAINGRVFKDNHANTSFSSGDVPVAGQTLYLDLNDNGIKDAGEPAAVTNPSGIYTFTDLPGGLSGTVRLPAAPAGFFLIPNGGAFTTAYNSGSQTIDFSLFPTTYSTANPSTNFTLNLDAPATTEQILVNGAVTWTVPANLLQYLTFSFTGTVDSLTVDATNGNPIPPGGITLNGASTGSALTVIGTQSENDSFVVNSSSISFGSNPINFSNVSLLTLNPGPGDNVLDVNSGSVTIPAQSPGLGILTRQFSALSVAAASRLNFAAATSHGDRTLIEATSLSVAGRLDLGGNDLIVHNGDLAATTALIAGGFANGNWNGAGIDSSAAAADTTHLTALGILTNNTGNNTPLFGGVNQSLFDGIAPLVTDLLIKYTYYGDTNLDGKVDGSDFTRIDNAFLFHQTGWFNGDSNYDGSVNGSDYSLIDNAFNTQRAAL